MDTTENRISNQRRRVGAIAAVVVLITFGVVLWQTWDYWRPADSMAEGARFDDAARRPPPPPGGFGGPPPSPQEMRRQVQEQIKTSLAASDQEWAKLRPAIEKVTLLQDQLRPPMQMGPGMGPKSEALRAAVLDQQTAADDLAATLASAREARKQTQAELKSAQDELRKLLTPKQEAVLALRGVLD